jgi:hypothetical protein
MDVSFVLKVAREPTHLEVLNEVVEHAEPFRVFAVLDVDQRADFCGLGGRGQLKHTARFGKAGKPKSSFDQ